MAEHGDRFELVGTVTTLEARKRRTGELIPGFWTLKINTPQGERTCSFNSLRRRDPKDPSSEEPHPDFPKLQQAQASGETVKVEGTVTVQGEGEQRKEFKNGRQASIVPAGTVAQSFGGETRSPNGASSAPVKASVVSGGLGIEEERAWRALAILVPLIEIEQPETEQGQVGWTKDKAMKLINVAKQLAKEQQDSWSG